MSSKSGRVMSLIRPSCLWKGVQFRFAKALEKPVRNKSASKSICESFVQCLIVGLLSLSHKEGQFFQLLKRFNRMLAHPRQNRVRTTRMNCIWVVHRITLNFCVIRLYSISIRSSVWYQNLFARYDSPREGAWKALELSSAGSVICFTWKLAQRHGPRKKW